MTLIENILDVARWAPSGDNTQPWRFEIVDDLHFIVHGFDTRDHCVYDLDGHPSQMAIGALLENIGIASAEWGHSVEFIRCLDLPDTTPTFNVYLKPESTIAASPLFPYIPVRATQRRRLSPQPLLTEQKRQIEEAAAPGYRILWFDGAKTKLKIANFLARSALIRLSIPEAYEVHKTIIQWNSRFSVDRIPDQAVGLDPLAICLMKWALKSWRRTHFMSAYLGGTLLPRIQLDWLPALYCAAHFIIVSDRKPESVDDYIAAGRAMQRVWLTAAQLGLQAQPEMTPLIFSRYAREGRRFTTVEKIPVAAKCLAADYAALVSPEAVEHAVFTGRIGRGKAPYARSLRLPLDKLMWQAAGLMTKDE